MAKAPPPPDAQRGDGAPPDAPPDDAGLGDLLEPTAVTEDATAAPASPAPPSDTVKCEWCGWEQTRNASIFCDRCGRRMERARTPRPPPDTAAGDAPAPLAAADTDYKRCSNCGDYSPADALVCRSCGEALRTPGL